MPRSTEGRIITAPPYPIQARSGLHVHSFDGALSLRSLRHPHRAFAFEVTCDLDHPAVRAALQADPPQKPPRHFHPHQAEYFQVMQGQAVVEAEIGGRAGMHRLQAGRQGVADDSEFCVPAGAHHTWYPSIAQVEDGRERNDSTNDISSRRDYGVSRVVVSGDTTPELLRLDWAFFENWYSYQDACFKKGRAIDLIQVMCMYDAGGSYLSLPGWVPLGRSTAVVLGIVIGRWLGGLLGYRPYYREWTTDWELACEKMDTCWLYRRGTKPVKPT
ncbi:uncharacterized protein PG998_006802 [Apiospora kogelbergensis]|uniref:Uncharacterized protein n=1 Tax=Apiospora kogelbergensis TaxID=1337665 RepID=A0AAW0QTZ3_9PEZI